MPKIFPRVRVIKLDEAEPGELVRFNFRGQNSLAFIARQEGRDNKFIVIIESTEIKPPYYFTLTDQGLRAISFGKDYRIILSMNPADIHLSRIERHGIFISSDNDKTFLFARPAPGEFKGEAWIDINSGILTHDFGGEVACISSWRIVIDDPIGGEIIEIFKYPCLKYIKGDE